MRSDSDFSSLGEPRRSSRWVTALWLLLGAAVGFLVQTHLHDGLHFYATARGFWVAAVRLVLVLGPLVVALAFVYAMGAQLIRLQVAIALAAGFFLGGFAAFVVDIFDWLLHR
jgi:Flp pilus assembly protein TadB